MADGAAVFPDGSGCFAADTMILMADGTSKPISEIKAHDVVRDGSEPNNLAVVSAVYLMKSQAVEEIDLNAPQSRIVATTEHLFWVDGKGWTAVSRLQPGDWVFNAADRRVQITGIKKIDAKTNVFTFKLSGDDAFYANDVLVHDYCGTPSSTVSADASTVEVAK